MTRSSRLLAAGVAVIVVGIIVLFVALSGDDPVEVVDGAPATGTEDGQGDDGTPATTPGGGTVGELGEDESRFPVPLVIPPGHEAVAVSLSFDRAAASLPTPGDRINVYGVFPTVPEELLTAEQRAVPAEQRSAVPGVIRAVSGVEVLGLTGTGLESAGTNTTFLLALEPDEAERVIFFAAHASMWFSIVPEGHEPVEGVGRTLDNVLTP